MGELSLADRATIANMSPEYGATMGFFPVDHVTLQYLKLTGRSDDIVSMIEAYLCANKIFVDYNEPQQERAYSSYLSLDLEEFEPCVSGPKRPHDRVPLKEMKTDWNSCLDNKVGFKGFAVPKEAQEKVANFSFLRQPAELKHGSIVIAAITSVEVKSGESLSVSPEEGRLIHVCQVALGEVKNIKGAQYVPIRMKIDDKKYIIGSLSAESRPHLTFDLVFEKEFELSHDWKDGSVFFCGYTADNPDQEEFGPEDFSDEDEDEEEDLILENGKVVPDVQVANPTKSKDAAKKPVSATKPKVTLVDPKKEESDEEEDSDDSDEELNDDSDDSDLSGDSDDDMSEDEETPKKAEPSKKRPSESATKTPVPAKKAKSDTPQKTDGKKGSGHKATPHPSKQAVKKTVETPKSSGQVSCKSCSKTFNSEKGLLSHSKAKHGGK